MQELAASRCGPSPSAFRVPEYDETRYARLVARHFGTEARRVPGAAATRWRSCRELVWHYDEPFADSSAVPTWYVAELTRRHVTVALTGDGGDELFAGYPRYQAVWLAGTVRSLARAGCGGWRRPLWQRLPSSSAAEVAAAALETLCRVLGQSPAAALPASGSPSSTRAGGRAV